MNPEEKSLLHNALRSAVGRSGFWRDHLAALGIQEPDITEGFPFDQIPLVSKADLLADQAASPPFGTLLAVPPSDVRRIHRTSGTTATPFFIALTERDIADTYHASERAFRQAGMGPGDRVVHCLNFNMWSGGITDYLPIERLNATGIPFGVGNTSLLLSLLRRLNVNAISSTPSYMFTLAERCRDELNIDPRDLGLRKGFFGGEGLLQVPGVRDRIESIFAMKAYDSNYGMSEVLSVIAGEGEDRDGLINHTHGILLTELVDSQGRSLPIEPGATGELVFSTLKREAQPLFRYRTCDIAEVLWREIGEDGLLRMRFHIRGRSDQMMVVKGVNFFPQSLMSVVAEFSDIGAAYCILRPPTGTVDHVDVVMETSVAEPERSTLAAAVERRASALLQVRFRVRWVPPGFLERSDNKARYLIDSPDSIPGLSALLGPTPAAENGGRC